MQDNLITALQDRWMSEKEAKVYLTVLELWSAPASTIGRRTCIKRVTAYAVLKDMEKKNIIHSKIRNGTLRFIAVKPKKLLHSLKAKFDLFDSLIGEFEDLQLTNTNHIASEYHEWLDWLKYIYHEIAISKWEIYAFLWADDYDSKLKQYLKNVHIKERIDNKTKAYVIAHSSEKNKEYQKKDKANLKETKIINNDSLSLYNETAMYWWDKIAFCMTGTKDLYWIIIQNKKLHDTMHNIFQFIWLQDNTQW